MYSFNLMISKILQFKIARKFDVTHFFRFEDFKMVDLNAYGKSVD